MKHSRRPLENQGQLELFEDKPAEPVKKTELEPVKPIKIFPVYSFNPLECSLGLQCIDGRARCKQDYELCPSSKRLCNWYQKGNMSIYEPQASK